MQNSLDSLNDYDKINHPIRHLHRYLTLNQNHVSSEP